MRVQLDTTILVASIINVIEADSGLRCYDFVPQESPSPLYIIELTSTDADNTKTSYRTKYNFRFHVISSNNQKSNVELYRMIHALDEALTDDITLPTGYQVVMTQQQGIQSIYTEYETNEQHAVVDYQITVCYGYATKD